MSAKPLSVQYPELSVPFSTGEQAVLRIKFAELASINTAKLDRTRFRDLLADAFKLTEQVIVDRIFRVFDVDLDGWLSWEEFVRGLATWKTPGEHVKFCFKIYDLSSDTYLSKDELLALLRPSLPTSPTDDEVKELVDLLHKRLDLDRDGKVSLGDWTASVAREPLLMQCLGKCLPARGVLEKFVEVEGVDVAKAEKALRRRSMSAGR